MLPTEQGEAVYLLSEELMTLTNFASDAHHLMGKSAPRSAIMNTCGQLDKIAMRYRMFETYVID